MRSTPHKLLSFYNFQIDTREKHYRSLGIDPGIHTGWVIKNPSKGGPWRAIKSVFGGGYQVVLTISGIDTEEITIRWEHVNELKQNKGSGPNGTAKHDKKYMMQFVKNKTTIEGTGKEKEYHFIKIKQGNKEFSFVPWRETSGTEPTGLGGTKLSTPVNTCRKSQPSDQRDFDCSHLVESVWASARSSQNDLFLQKQHLEYETWKKTFDHKSHTKWKDFKCG